MRRLVKNPIAKIGVIQWNVSLVELLICATISRQLIFEKIVPVRRYLLKVRVIEMIVMDIISLTYTARGSFSTIRFGDM